MHKPITIIGAGIGGLTTALALKKNGCEVTVYESADEIKPVGAGIIMANNAMQVFRKLGIQQKIEKAGNKISTIKITDEKLKTISEMEASNFEAKYGVYNISIHRADLQKILAEEIGFDNIKLSKRLSKVERNDTFKLTFEDNTTEECAVLIGADGIKSTVRNQLFGSDEIRDAKQVCWRGVCEVELPEEYQHVAYEAWGKGRRFGFAKMSDKKTYWFAVINEHFVHEKQENLFDLYETFHPDVHKIIAATPDSAIFLSRITDLKPFAKWHSQNVCLIGDAAHATTPNMGQGACQAVEDAYTLGKLIQSDLRIDKVFAEYERLRIKKAHYIVNTSWTLGKVSHWENRLGRWLRNNALKSIPKLISTKQMNKIFDIDYV